VTRIPFVGETSLTEFPNHYAQFMGDWVVLTSRNNGEIVTQAWPSRLIQKVDVIHEDLTEKKVNL
jgi:hypothetical protein